MGTQKNRLDETVLLSTQNICKNLRVRKYLHFTLKSFVYLGLWPSSASFLHVRKQEKVLTSFCQYPCSSELFLLADGKSTKTCELAHLLYGSFESSHFHGVPKAFVFLDR